MRWDRADWIAQTREEPVDPTRQIVDAHHHLWRDRKWMYELDDLLADTRSAHDVTHTVFVECHANYYADGPEELRVVGETAFVAERARASDARETHIAAIVGTTDLRGGDVVDEVLTAHEAAGDGRFRGIRQVTAWDPNVERPGMLTERGPDLMADPEFRRGVARLGERGFSYDAFLFHPQLGALADLAEAVPGTTIVLDHLGAPLGFGPYGTRDDVRPEWRAGMQRLASLPNVALKLSGIGMDSILGLGWAARDVPIGSDEAAAVWGDDFRWCIDAFGVDRCMFASNFPVDREAIGYTVLWNTFQKIAAEYSEDEQRQLFAGTAAAVYRIDLDTDDAPPDSSA